MSFRVSNSIEKSVRCVPSVPVTIVAGAASVIALPDITTGVEYTARYIQNVGTGNLYYAFGYNITADGTGKVAMFNGILAGTGATDAGGFGPGQQLDASNDPEAIYVYSPAGTVIVVSSLKKNDIGPGIGGILTPNSPNAT